MIGGEKMFERLRALRKEKGLTCEDMAEVLGLETKSAYSKKENGSTKFSLDDAKKVSSILNKSIEDIFFADEVSFKDTKNRVQGGEQHDERRKAGHCIAISE